MTLLQGCSLIGYLFRKSPSGFQVSIMGQELGDQFLEQSSFIQRRL